MLVMKFLLTGWILSVVALPLALIYKKNILIRIIGYGGFSMALISTLILIWTV